MTQLRIAVDMVSAGEGLGVSSGGMSVYFQGLLPALAALPEVDEVICLRPPWDLGFEITPCQNLRFVRCLGLPRFRIGRVGYEQLVLPGLVASLHPDVLFCTCNVRPLLRRAPTAVVLQSFQYLSFRESYGRLRRAYLANMIPRSLRGADAVIAVSEAARREAIDLFGLDPERVIAVHHGVSKTVLERTIGGSAGEPFTLPGGKPYLLMVSSLYRHKNHARLIEAFAEAIRRRAVPHDLVIAGGDADVTRMQLEAVAERFGVRERVHFLGAVPHRAVPSLLAGADAVAYISLFETFGLPIIEAMAAGVPLVTSETGAPAEVAADGAYLVDPRDPQNMAAGLIAVLMDEDVRRRLRIAGPRRAATFTWDRCARGTLQALKLACGLPIETRAANPSPTA